MGGEPLAGEPHAWPPGSEPTAKSHRVEKPDGFTLAPRQARVASPRASSRPARKEQGGKLEGGGYATTTGVLRSLLGAGDRGSLRMLEGAGGADIGRDPRPRRREGSRGCLARTGSDLDRTPPRAPRTVGATAGTRSRRARTDPGWTRTGRSTFSPPGQRELDLQGLNVEPGTITDFNGFTAIGYFRRHWRSGVTRSHLRHAQLTCGSRGGPTSPSMDRSRGTRSRSHESTSRVRFGLDGSTPRLHCRHRSLGPVLDGQGPRQRGPDQQPRGHDQDGCTYGSPTRSALLGPVEVPASASFGSSWEATGPVQAPGPRFG